MRKLTYEIFDRNGTKCDEVSSYDEMMNYKEKGFSIKDKLTELHKRLVYEIFKDKEKVGETSLLKEMLKAKKDGYTIKAITRVY